MDDKAVARYLKDLVHGVLPDKKTLLEIVDAASELLAAESNVVAISGPTAVVGDLHGQYYDFLAMLSIIEPGRCLLFLGDYVDRGYNSVELLLHVLMLKLSSPSTVFLLRGNHENRGQTAVYGFMEECVRKYDMYVYWCLCDLFKYMPLAAVVNSHYVCLHGGLIPSLSLDELKTVDRVQEYPDMGGIMWSDPCDDVDGFKLSQRGAGYRFGARAVCQFLDSHRLGVLVRSHQLVMDGAREDFGGKCVTVWSAPNYCYKCKNVTTYMKIDKKEHKFVYFEAVSEQYRAGDIIGPSNN